MKIVSINKSIFYILLLILILCFLNVSRNIDNDLGNYIETYLFFTTHGFLEAFGNSDFLFLVKPTEPIFYFLTYVLSKLFFGKIFLYIGALTFIFYFNFISGIFKLLNFFEVSSKKYFFFFCIVIFASINFSETSHLLRQYFAGSFIPLLIFFLFKKSYFKAVLLSIFIVLIHNSLSIIIFLLFLSNFSYSFISKYFIITLISTFFLFSLFLYYSLRYLYALSYFEEPAVIRYISMYYDFFILIFYFLFSFFLRKKIPIWNNFFIIFTLLYLVFLLNLTFNETVFLRFYLNIEWFRFFYFFIIILSMDKIKANKYYKLLFYFLIFTVFVLRFIVSPWHYFSFELFI